MIAGIFALLTPATLRAAWTWFKAVGWKFLVGVLAVACGWYAVSQVSTSQLKVKASEDAVKVSDKRTTEVIQYRVIDDRTTHNVAVAKAALEDEEAIKLEATRQANAANADWANQPIPDDVLVSLRD